MRALSRSDQRLSLTEIGLFSGVLAIVLLIVWAGAIRIINSDERHASDAARATVQRETDQLALEWEARLAQIKAIHILAREVTRMSFSHNPDLADRMEDLRGSLRLSGPDFTLVSGIDPDGNLLWTTGTAPSRPVSVQDRAYFRELASGGRDAVVGRPNFGRVSGSWTLPFTEAARTRDGALEFATVLAVRADVIKTMTRYFDVNQATAIMLLRRDGVVLAREPPLRIGEDLKVGAQIRNAAEAHGLTVGRHTSGIDGVPRFYAMRAIPGSDLLVSVAITEDAAMAGAHEAETATLWWASALSLVSIALMLSIALSIAYHRRSKARHAALQKALDNEALLTQFAAKANDVIALVDANLNYIYLNAAYQNITSLPTKSLIGTRIGQSLAEEDRHILESEFAKIVHDGNTRRFTLRVQSPTAGMRWMESEIVRLNQPGTGLARGPNYLVISRDVTDRLTAGAALIETQEHVKTLLRIGDGFLAHAEVDLAGRKLRLNVSPLTPDRELAEAALARAATGNGKGLVYLDDEALVRDGFMRCREDGEATVELRYNAIDGTVRWRRAQLVLMARHAESSEVVIYASDITRERESRQRMQLVERLATLGEVTTHLAHELNQPVASIMLATENGIARLERNPADTADAVARLGRIQTMAERMGQIIDHIRSFGRTDISARQPFELGTLLMEIQILAASRLMAAGTTLSFGNTSTLPLLTVPRIPLEQVLLNLVANACDAYDANPAVPPGQREIVINVNHIDNVLQLSVTDRAGGIPTELIDKVFDSFFTTKSAHKGTGVGLSISRTLMNEMGGGLQVHNANGGAVFILNIPLAAQPALVSG